MRRVTYSILFLLTSALPTISVAQSGTLFWPYWRDGKAEVNHYIVETRTGGKTNHSSLKTRYLIEREHWKTRTDSNESITLDTMRFDLARHIETSPSRCDHILSLLSPTSVHKSVPILRRAITPLEVVFEARGCETSHKRTLRALSEGYRYSDTQSAESGNSVLPYQFNMITADDLFVRVRELLAPLPAGGYKLLTSTLYPESKNPKPKWVPATVEKLVVRDWDTAFGSIPVSLFIVSTTRQVYRFWVESTGQKRLLEWQIQRAKGSEFRENARLQHSARITMSAKTQDPSSLLSIRFPA